MPPKKKEPPERGFIKLSLPNGATDISFHNPQESETHEWVFEVRWRDERGLNSGHIPLWSLEREYPGQLQPLYDWVKKIKDDSDEDPDYEPSENSEEPPENSEEPQIEPIPPTDQRHTKWGTPARWGRPRQHKPGPNFPKDPDDFEFVPSRFIKDNDGWYDVLEGATNVTFHPTMREGNRGEPMIRTNWTDKHGQATFDDLPFEHLKDYEDKLKEFDEYLRRTPYLRGYSYERDKLLYKLGRTQKLKPVDPDDLTDSEYFGITDPPTTRLPEDDSDSNDPSEKSEEPPADENDDSDSLGLGFDSDDEPAGPFPSVPVTSSSEDSDSDDVVNEPAKFKEKSSSEDSSDSDGLGFEPAGPPTSMDVAAQVAAQVQADFAAQAVDGRVGPADPNEDWATRSDWDRWEGLHNPYDGGGSNHDSDWSKESEAEEQPELFAANPQPAASNPNASVSVKRSLADPIAGRFLQKAEDIPILQRREARERRRRLAEGVDSQSSSLYGSDSDDSADSMNSIEKKQRDYDAVQSAISMLTRDPGERKKLTAVFNGTYRAYAHNLDEALEAVYAALGYKYDRNIYGTRGADRYGTREVQPQGVVNPPTYVPPADAGIPSKYLQGRTVSSGAGGSGTSVLGAARAQHADTLYENEHVTIGRSRIQPAIAGQNNGLIAKKDIPKGTRIANYQTGAKILDQEGFDKLYSDNLPTHVWSNKGGVYYDASNPTTLASSAMRGGADNPNNAKILKSGNVITTRKIRAGDEVFLGYGGSFRIAKPAEVEASAFGESGYLQTAKGSKPSGYDSDADREGTVVPATVPLPSGWQQAISSKRRTYYFNRELKLSQYEVPPTRASRVFEDFGGVLENKVGRMPDDELLMREASDRAFSKLQRTPKKKKK